MLLSFTKNFKFMERELSVVDVDVERVLKPLNDGEKWSCCNWIFFICFYNESLFFCQLYRWYNYMEWFVKEIKQLGTYLEMKFWCPYHIVPFIHQKLAEYNTVTHYYIWKLPFISNDKDNRDHFRFFNNRRSKITIF